MIPHHRVLTRPLASYSSYRRHGKRNSADTRKRRLAILPLEDRVVPFNYTVNNNAEGALVEIIGTDGTVEAVTDAVGIAVIDNPPAPSPGIGGTAFWGADVVLPPGFDFFISKDYGLGAHTGRVAASPTLSLTRKSSTRFPRFPAKRANRGQTCYPSRTRITRVRRRRVRT